MFAPNLHILGCLCIKSALKEGQKIMDRCKVYLRYRIENTDAWRLTGKNTAHILIGTTVLMLVRAGLITIYRMAPVRGAEDRGSIALSFAPGSLPA